MDDLKIRLFGEPAITRNGQDVSPRHRKSFALLAYLCENTQPHTRERLAALFWPENNSKQAFAYLRNSLWELKQSLGSAVFNTGRETIQYNPIEFVQVDTHQFNHFHLAANDSSLPVQERTAALKNGLKISGGDFLTGFFIEDSPEFENWQRETSEVFKQKRFNLFQKLAENLAKQQQYEAAIETVHDWLKQDGLNETAHRILMQLLAESGQRSTAVQQFKYLQKLLNDELGIEPEEATLRLHEEILAGNVSSRSIAREAAPASTPVGKQVSLPEIAAPFFGREAELDRIRAELTSDSSRLLTILAPGGMGKTRLSIQAGQLLTDDFDHGVFFVGLSAVSTPDQVFPAVAEILQIHPKEKQLAQRRSDYLENIRAILLDFLRQRKILLILDNFEQLLAAADQINEMLEAAPGLKILITSQERLNIPAEKIMPLYGIPLPGEQQLKDLIENAAVQLFVQRARQAFPEFQPDENDLQHILKICTLVEGQPLAIEIAAAWVKVLKADEIAAEIERNLDFLASDFRGIPERQRSLRAVFNYAWQRLSGEEQQILSKLSIFRGGFTRDAAAVVCGASLMHLASLVDKTLLYRDSDGRFELHSMVRNYAYEKLEHSPETNQTVYLAHSCYYLEYAISQLDHLFDRNFSKTIRHFENEVYNFRLAWQTALQEKLFPLLCDALVSFVFAGWATRAMQVNDDLILFSLNQLQHNVTTDTTASGLQQSLTFIKAIHYNNRSNHFQKVIDRSTVMEILNTLPELPDSIVKGTIFLLIGFGRAFVERDERHRFFNQAVSIFKSEKRLWGVGLALMIHGQTEFLEENLTEKTFPTLRKAVEILQDNGADWWSAFCLVALSQMQFWAGDYNSARQASLEALVIYENSGKHWQSVGARFNLGMIAASQGEFDQARQYYQENIAVLEELGQRFPLAQNLDSLGYVELINGNYDQAEKYYLESLQIYQSLEHDSSTGMALSNLGDLELQRDNLKNARHYLEDGLDHFRKAPILYTWEIAVCEKKLAAVYARLGIIDLAKETWQQALMHAVQSQNTPEMLEVLSILPSIQKSDSSEDWQMLASIYHHPAASQVLKQEVLKRKERSVLSTAQMENSWQAGASLELEHWLTKFC